MMMVPPEQHHKANANGQQPPEHILQRHVQQLQQLALLVTHAHQQLFPMDRPVNQFFVRQIITVRPGQTFRCHAQQIMPAHQIPMPDLMMRQIVMQYAPQGNIYHFMDLRVYHAK
jgi:hypothetical protein